MLPISTIDKPGFKAMLQKFKYRLPSCNHFIRVSIPEPVAETKGVIEKEIAVGNVEYFSTTTDLWTLQLEIHVLPLHVILLTSIGK